MERCSNCHKYPFCEKCKSPTGHCDDWKSKRIMLEKYEDKKGE